ncbi:MAG: hypothetical protein RJQ09_10195 [Cyclobacteriaceae bacterium]
MLKEAEKYNWWTPATDKGKISIESKILYLLERGSLEELSKAVKQVGGDKIYNVWKAHLKGKELPKRKLVIEHFVKTHRNR